MMTDVDGSSLLADPQSSWSVGLGLVGYLALSLHSSNEPGELSQWPCHDDSTINNVTDIIIMSLLLLLRY